ncbi:hypothetical protein M422DRAFT_265251 [Sphaerobolus stellatus SS14]|uniref:Uncharacterized protein n=1 Tax=Sphaerobolus stellatus (strain SS14) TaxID=990650 RepID=A0A0C9V6G0_SPHS4|nr:hypothetical protein M422DRAFT_265251 [Sphaerobolus stellatus SS14]
MGWLETVIQKLNPTLMERWKVNPSQKQKVLKRSDRQEEKTNTERSPSPSITMNSDDLALSTCVVVPRATRGSTSPQKRVKRKSNELDGDTMPESPAKKPWMASTECDSKTLKQEPGTSLAPDGKRIKLESGLSPAPASTEAGVEAESEQSGSGKRSRKTKEKKARKAARPPSSRLQAKQAKPEAAHDSIVEI